MSNTCLKCSKDIGNESICPECGKTEDGVASEQTYGMRLQVLGVVTGPSKLQPLDGIVAAKKSASEADILRSIVDKDLKSEPNELSKRYKQINAVEKDKCMFAPNDKIILERIIGPSRHAKASFVAGNFIGCIALCGMVAEMLSVMLFEAFEDELIGQSFTKKNTTTIADVSWFETQKAADRFKCLRDHGQLTPDVYDALEHIRDQRNKFLHLYSQDYSKLESIAKTVYGKLLFAVDAILGKDIRDNKFHLAAKLRDWLARPRS